jgi:Zn-dependent peptidase ImmA (M78 family)
MPVNRKPLEETIGAAVAESRAEELLSSLGITDPTEIGVEDIAMNQGALVLEGGLAGAEARLTRSPQISFIRVNSEIRELGRRRFGIAHEIGHLILHKDRGAFAICSQNDVILFASNDQKELQANIFAAALLMPTRMFEPRCKLGVPSLALIGQLAQEFEVTLTAAARRFIEFSPHRCCLVVSKSGRIRYHCRSQDFGYFITPSEELRPLSYAADFYAGKQIPKGMHTVPANAWLEGAQIDGSKRIMEDSISMPSYDSVLTLLWIDRDIDHYVTGDGEEDEEQRKSDARWSWNRYRRDRE